MMQITQRNNNIKGGIVIKIKSELSIGQIDLIDISVWTVEMIGAIIIV